MIKLFSLDTQLNLQDFFTQLAKILVMFEEVSAIDLTTLFRLHEALSGLIEINLSSQHVMTRANEIGNLPVLNELNSRCFLLWNNVENNAAYLRSIATLPKDQVDEELSAANITQELIQNLNLLIALKSNLASHMIEFNEIDESKLMFLTPDDRSDSETCSYDSPVMDATVDEEIKFVEESSSPPVVSQDEEIRRTKAALELRKLFNLFGPQKPNTSSATANVVYQPNTYNTTHPNG